MTWAGISRAVRIPTLFDTSVNSNNADNNQLIGNQDLKSEEVLAYEAGYRYLAEKKWWLDLSFFYNTYDDLSVYRGTILDDGFQLRSENAISATSYGIESAIHWHQLVATVFSFLDTEARAQEGFGIGVILP